MSDVQILVLAGVIWFVLATVVGLSVGAVIKHRDTQKPKVRRSKLEARSSGRKPRKFIQHWPPRKPRHKQ